MTHFCTYFDSVYLHRGLALYRSLEKRTEVPFTLWILCFDRRTYDILNALNLKNAKLIKVEEFEAGDSELLLAKENRTRVEYYWTCTPSLLLYLFRHHSNIELLIYVDADIFFFSSPLSIIKELGSNSILINLQDLSNGYAGAETSGKYNVGVMAFRNDSHSLSCIHLWRECCLASCYYRPHEGKYGDQQYLDDWPDKFANVIVSQNIGVRLAPWNISKYTISDKHGQLMVNNCPVICYHFHALYFCTKYLAYLAGWNAHLSTIVINSLYIPYILDLLIIESELIRKNFSIRLHKHGIPYRYIMGRLLKLQPIAHFLWISPRKYLENVKPKRNSSN